MGESTVTFTWTSSPVPVKWTIYDDAGKVIAEGGTPDEVISNFKTQQKEDTMSDSHARMRVVLDFPVDPSTASPRVMKALAKEAKEYAQVVLVKDREIVLTDHVEVIDVHVHKSTESEACATCVQKLAMDERQ